MDETTTPTTPSEPAIETHRADDFKAIYSNHVIVGSSAWDLTLTFSRFVEVNGKRAVEQEVAATIPFGLAKLITYWMETQIIANEIETGRRVTVRESLYPPPVPALTAEQEKSPFFVKYREAMRELREKFIASLS
jgi:hypothetical protein